MSQPAIALARILGHPLSPEQLAAATAPLAPALVRAGAGTGKTTVMAARVAWLIHSGAVDPARVLGLTFTNKAAGELSERVRKVLPEDEDLGEPNIGTYHGFAYELLQQHGLRLGLESEFDVLDEGARFQLAYRVVCDFERTVDWQTDPGRVAAEVLSLDAELAEHVVTPAQVRARTEAFDRDLLDLVKPDKYSERIGEANRDRLIAVELVERYREAKRTHSRVDFGDYMRYITDLVEIPTVVEAVRTQYDVVLLDEYQDTSVAQERMLLALFGGGHPVTAVGDPHQSIYGFRGASAASMERFPDTFRDRDRRPAAVYPLTENRRSGAEILVAANKIVAPLRRPNGLDLELVPLPDAQPADVRVSLFETESEEVAWVAEQVAEYVRTTGKPGDVAILCRTRRGFADLHRELSALDVPVEVVGLGGLLELPDIVEICCVLRLLNDPAENPSLLRILSGPKWRLGARDLRLLARRAGELAGASYGSADKGSLDSQLASAVAEVDPVDIVSLLDAVEDPGAADYDPRARERFARLAAQLKGLRRHVGEPLVDLVHRVAVQTGLEVEFSVGTDSLVVERRNAFGTFLDVVAGFKPFAGAPTLSALLAWLEARARQSDAPEPERPSNTSAVALMTVHAAKGLEYPMVVLPFLTETVFPKKAYGSQASLWLTTPGQLPDPLRGDANSRPSLGGFAKQQIEDFRGAVRDYAEEEERRLMYVAATRAKSVLLASGSWWGQTQKNSRGPSIFLLELHESATEELWCPQPDAEVNPTLGESAAVSWHEGDGTNEPRSAAAQLVRDVMAGRTLAVPVPSVDEAVEIADWDRRLELLVAEAQSERSGQRTVALPSVISASQMLNLQQDAERFARELYRPMPRPLNRAARVGIAFHAWLEARFQSWSLISPDELPGSSDAPAADLAPLQAAFEKLPYATQTPVAVEVPVSVRLAGRTIVGRIDAVFSVGGDYEIVDWKTGGPDHVTPLQLALYRLAWAEQCGIELSRVRGAFVYVATSRIEVFDDLPDRAALTALLSS